MFKRRLLIPTVIVASAATVPGLALAAGFWITNGAGKAAAQAGTIAPPAAVSSSAQSATTITLKVDSGPASGGTPTSYRVDRTSATTPGAATGVCTISAVGGTCTDTGLTASSSYTYVVRSVIGTNWLSGPSSNVSTSTTASPVTTPSTPDMLAADDKGASSTDDVTNLTTPRFTGTGGTSGNTIKLYFDGSGTPNGQATVASDGTWTVTPSSALSGAGTTGTVHTVKAQENNGATLSSLSTQLSFTVDTTVPAASGETATNKPGPPAGTPGKAELGDKITLQYSENMTPASILSGWDGTSTNIVVHGNDVASLDTVTFFTANNGAQLPLGTLQLGDNDYFSGNVTFGLAGSAVLSTMTMDSTGLVTITFGTVSDATKTGTTGTNDKGALTWTPSATARDIAGNAASTTANGNGLNANYF